MTIVVDTNILMSSLLNSESPINTKNQNFIHLYRQFHFFCIFL